MKVLVTGAGALLGQGLIRAVRTSNLHAHIVAVDPNPLSAGLYWADSAHLVPMASEPGYLEAIRALLRAENPAAVLVGTDVELAFFAHHRLEFEQEFQTKVIVSTPSVVAIADDKWLTYEFLKKGGFHYPESALPGDDEALIARVGFPLVVKPRHGARSVGVSVVRSLPELTAALVRGRDLIVQECVGMPVDEYTSGLICFDGRCHASITMRRDLRDGNTYRAFPLPDFPHDAELRRIAEAIGAHGPINLQFRLAGGKVKVFEINGRFSGTTPLRGLVGFPEVEMVLRHVLHNEPVMQPAIRQDVILRYWTETVVPAERILREKNECGT
jgi:carbamoyl-phosphate synthase large subunit